jgi:hypothetical protein
MKKNYLLAIAVAALMLASEVAWAADISFSGQFRPRFQSTDDWKDTTDSRNYFTQRTRLNAKATVNANTEIFLQFQSVGTWGNAGASSGTRVSVGDATSANDLLDDVGFHEAHLTLKNFMGKAVNVKMGRQQVVLDGHRLFGHTGWTDGGQSSDAIRLDHSGGNHTLNYIYIAGTENEANSAADDANVNFHIFRANTQGVLGGDLTGMFVVVDDNSASATLDDMNTWYTVGARQKGKAGGLDYRVEFYHQFGDGAVRATAAAFSGAYTAVSNSADIDRSASMVGVRVGKTFKNAKMSPTFTLWYDSLSGTDDTDASSGDWGTFDTHMDTGHKFYGLMDLYLGQNGGKTGYYGLQDYAIKSKWKLDATNTFKADFHHFRTQTDMSDGDSNTLISNDSKIVTQPTNDSGDLGSEIDLTLVHKYDSNTKIVAGYSHYWSSQLLAALRNSGNNQDADWIYLMVDTKF